MNAEPSGRPRSPSPPVIHRLAERQHGVVGRAQLLAEGLTTDSVERRCRGWTRLHAGVYALPGTADVFPRRVMAAIVAAGGLAVASHRTAAHLLGLCEEPDVPTISVPRTQRPRLTGVIVQRPTCLVPEHLAWVGPIRVTSANRTICDLADDPGCEVILDRALKKRIAHPEAIRRLLESLPRLKGRRGLVALLDARPTGKPLVESPLEGRLHRLLRDAGITGWTPQVELLLDGRLHRLDAAFPHVKLGVETDGYAHHSSPSEWERDRTRNARLVASGWRILSVTNGDLRDRPAEVVALVRRALAATSVAVS